MTNSERIRNMTDEKLAELLIFYNEDYGRYECPNGEYIDEYEYNEAVKLTVEWLRSECDNA